MNKFLVAGLGNPGPRYSKNRHNVGFMLIEALASRHLARINKTRCEAFTGEFSLGDSCRTTLAMPQTFMNDSGRSVVPLLRYMGITTPASQLIVIHDDLDLPCGVLRIKLNGGAGGHNGIKSIIDHLGGNKQFIRFKIGIGRPAHQGTVHNHVLSNFSNSEASSLSQQLETYLDALDAVILEGATAAMNSYNHK